MHPESYQEIQLTETVKAMNKEKSCANPRNSDKRRERSKVAARCRRGKESEIFANLAACLPLPESMRSILDKASIARITVTYLKLREMMNKMFTSASIDLDSTTGLELGTLTNNALGGFVIVFSSEGDVIYVSESITQHLGLSQCEVMGHSVYDFSHPCDHVDIKDLFAVSKTDDEVCQYRTGFFRMKCTITSKGRSVHLRAASYKAINCTGHLFTGNSIASHTKWYVGIGEPIPDPTNIPFPLNKQAFVTRHSTDMKCEDVAGSVEDFLGYIAEDLIGKSLFEFHHAADGLLVGKYFKSLYVKGQIQTDRYRFLARNGGWAWVMTQATVLKSNNEPSGVVCLHFVTSDIENRDEILSTIQVRLALRDSKISDRADSPDFNLPILLNSLESGVTHVVEENCRPSALISGAGLSSPTPSTSKIFAPRTDDMDTGFLLPSDNSLMGEPDDLTHLAPIAGDECVSLNVPLLDDLLKSFDQANLEYSLCGYMSDAVDLPLLKDQVALNKNSHIEGSSCASFIPDTSFLLFNNSDPNMGRAIDFDAALLSPIQNPLEDSYMTGLSDYQCPNDTSMQYRPGKVVSPESNEGFIGNAHSSALLLPENSTDLKTGPPEDLSVFTAPYIPVGPDEDFALFHAGSEFTWPPGLDMISSPADADIVSGGKDDKIRNDELVVKYGPITNTLDILNLKPNQSTRKPMLKDENINKVRWTVDIESILGSRKPGDLPKVVTKYIFANTGPPAVKVRKLGLMPPKLGNYSTSLLRHADSVSGSSGSTLEYDEAQWILGNRSEMSNGTVPETGRAYESTISVSSVEDNTSPLRKRDLFGKLLGNDTNGIPTLFELTRQDCDVNVPLEHSSLLQGAELIIALETENSVDPVQ